MLGYTLETDGFLVDRVTNGQDALRYIAKTHPHIVLLNETLPDISGIEICRRFRSRLETQELRMIVVTGCEGGNAVRSFNAGADDCVFKPVSVPELLRIRAILRRTPPFPAERWLRWGEIAMDLAAFRARRNGRNIHLGPIEFKLLKLLMQHPKQVFSRQELIDALWGPRAHVQPRSVDVHVRRLRKAVTQEGELNIIRTVHMAGYVLDPE
jgi:two-component system, OmpR family, phosphate regulon response regulator PhoB